MVCSKICPIDVAIKYVGKKWTIEIIKDLFLGMSHFNEFLEANPALSAKVLSQRLKEMEQNGIVEKRVISVTPISIEYHLTSKGKALNKVIYELAGFAMIAYGDECGPGKNSTACQKKTHFDNTLSGWKKVLGIES